MHSIVSAFLDIQQMYSIFLHFRYHLRLISHTINKRSCNNGRRRGCFLRPALQVLSNMHNILEFFQFYFYNPWFGKREERKITQNVFQSSIGFYELDKFCCGLLLSFPKCEKWCTVITLHVGVDFNLYLIFGWKDWLSTPWFGLCRPFSTFVIIKNVINL